jgi:hypothetical protein
LRTVACKYFEAIVGTDKATSISEGFSSSCATNGFAAVFNIPNKPNERRV